jgi:large exoprotein involved in heme utilization and adhesion
MRAAIYGRLSANGQVFLINPNGILFAPSAKVDVGGLVASTLSLSDSDFMAGKTQFVNAGAAGGISNFGELKAGRGGYIALLAPDIHNAGTITAPQGSVALAAGNKVTLDFFGDSFLKVKVDEAALNAQIANSGALLAEGGRVVLSARAAGDLVASVINNTGIIRATGLVERNGEIVLDGGERGTTQISGMLDVSGTLAGSRGGKISIAGSDIVVAGANIDASGQAAGGTILVGGDAHGVQVQIDGAPHANAHTLSVDAASVISADATSSGTGGKVILWSDNATAFAGRITARGGALGGDGGTGAERSGRRVRGQGRRRQLAARPVRTSTSMRRSARAATTPASC